MKRTTLFAFVITVVFVVGCNDTNITNPINQSHLGDQLLSEDMAPGTITFNTVLREPLGFNTWTEVKGQIAYTTVLVPHDPIPPAPQWTLEVTLDIDAALSPYGTQKPVWFVHENSLNVLVLDETNDHVVVMEKSFNIEGRRDRMSLRMEFQVQGQTLTLEKIWLQQIR